MMRTQDGILNLVKPVGVSSFGFLKRIQKKLDLKKVGHLGTLDPNACGVLVLLCGRATKLNVKLSGGTKVYRSVFTFGIETDTLDTAGKVIATSNKIPTKEEFLSVLPTGDVEIEVPKFSAVHINGARAYDLARSGIDFTPPKKTVKILRFELLAQIAHDKFFVEIECETGTYVRSLAKLVAQRLGTVSIASSILRVRVGDFDIRDAKSLINAEYSDIIPYEKFV